MFLYTPIVRLPPDLSAHLVSSDLASWKTPTPISASPPPGSREN